MRHTLRLAALALALLVASVAAADQQTRGTATTYVATLVDSTHILPMAESVPITIRLERFTTGSEASHFSDVARARDETALRKALSEDFIGQLRIDNHLSDPIAYARRVDDQSGHHLMLIAQRPLSMREIFQGWPSVDYPFTVIELDLGPNGAGSGTIYLAARIRPHENGEIELVGYDFLPSRLMAVKKVAS
jgi:hypothetical protein